MDQLNHEGYLALRSGAEVIEADQYGEKVLRLADGTFLKLFRRKRLISSAAWYPYAQRFANNCEHLSLLYIPCPIVIATYRIVSVERDAAHYYPLLGNTLRQCIEAGMSDSAAEALRAQLRDFIARLHCLGIYFRSLHLGNIVLTPQGSLGLIDVADLTIHRHALGQRSVFRNMQHLMRYPADVAWLTSGSGFPLS